MWRPIFMAIVVSVMVLGGVLPAAYADQLGHARLRARTLAGQRSEGRPGGQQTHHRRPGHARTDCGALLCDLARHQQADCPLG